MPTPSASSVRSMPIRVKVLSHAGSEGRGRPVLVRLDESRTRTSGGTGLGLAIGRAITAAHGGSLCVEAGVRGARFVLKLSYKENERHVVDL